MLWSARAVLAAPACKEIKVATRRGAWCLQSLLVVAVELLAAAQQARHLQVDLVAAALAQLLIWLARRAHRGKVLRAVVHRVKRSITLRAAAGTQVLLA